MKQCNQQLEFFPAKHSEKKTPAKRVSIVSLKMVRESIPTPLVDADREHFLVICLDTKNQVNSITTIHIGTLNASVVHPREVGISSPSQEDVTITKRLVEAGEVLGIELLDHLVIAGDCFYSLKEGGHI